MLNFDFLEKDLGKSFHHILCLIFQGKWCSCHILLTDQMSISDWLPLNIEILRNMCIAIVCSSGCEVIDFETNLIFLHDHKVRTNI